MSAPEGAQLSEDGHYYWDGTAWQLVDHGAAGAADPAAGSADPAAAAGGGGMPSDIEHEITNFKAYYPELATLVATSDHDTYLTQVIGVSEVPTDNATA